MGRLGRGLGALVVATAIGVGGLVAALGGASAALAEDKPVTLATGSELGAYFPIGIALRLTMQEAGALPAGGLAVVGTRGSVDNLIGIGKGDYDLAIAQADQVRDAYQGRDVFQATGKIENLRVVMRLHEEELVLLTRRDSNIAKFKDLKGKRVYPGPVGSGLRPVAREVLARLDAGGQAQVVEIKATESATALCDNKVDAVFYLVGNPSAEIAGSMMRCPGRILAIPDKVAQAIENDNPPMERAVLPAGTYPGQNKAVKTVGVAALIVARAETPDAVVTSLIKSVWENLDLLRNLHPALTDLSLAGLRPAVGALPPHPAAARFFEEHGVAP